jgi:hypothetical protein
LRDVCILGGEEAEVSNPDSKPPYVHLSCVLKATTPPLESYNYPKMMKLNLGSPFGSHGNNPGKFQPGGAGRVGRTTGGKGSNL